MQDSIAMLARTAGIALVIAFSVHLFFHHRRQWTTLTLLGFAPILLWSGLKWILNYRICCIFIHFGICAVQRNI